MTYADKVQEQLREARHELEAAEQALASGDESARVRYTRALHGVDLAERHAWRMTRESQRQQQSWRPSAS